MRIIFSFLVFCFFLTQARAGSGVDSLIVSRDSIVSFAKKYLGLPYRYAGKKPDRGFDCSGYTSYVFHHFNIKLSSSSSLQALQGNQILLKDAIPGDLVFFRRSKRGRVFHVALVDKIVNDSIFVIHSTTHGGIRIDNLAIAPFWKTKYKSIRNVLPGDRNVSKPENLVLKDNELSHDLTAETGESPTLERTPFEITALLPTLAILPKWKPTLMGNQ
jgi:hypothetical protein